MQNHSVSLFFFNQVFTVFFIVKKKGSAFLVFRDYGKNQMLSFFLKMQQFMTDQFLSKQSLYTKNLMM